jgi:hypothetical protein
MPTDKNVPPCDSFNECHRAGHKFGPRAPETPVPMSDSHLATIFNPHGKEGGVHVANDYPRVESKLG